MTYIFVFFVGMLIYFQYKREKNIINLVSLLMGPYMVLVALNNLLMYKIGFYKINDDVLVMLLAAFLLFFMGSLFTAPNMVPQINEKENIIRFEKYNIKRMSHVIFIIGIIGIIKLAYAYLSGRFTTGAFEDAEGYMGSGIVGHLLLLSYSILPIVFLYWTYNKKQKICLIGPILVFIVAFSTFIKYNVIGLAVSTFIFVLMYKKSLFKKALIVLISFIIVAFISNYAIGFLINEATVSSTFYVNHFWLYSAGSIINANNIFTSGINIELSLLEKLLIFAFAFPNMFLHIINVRLFPYKIMEPSSIGTMHGQTTNVLDAVSYLYPSKGKIYEIILFGLFMLIIGFIFATIYIKCKKKSRTFNIFVSNFMTFFLFLSFFGTFYINAGPWEILVYSAVVPRLFFRNRKYVISFSLSSVILHRGRIDNE